MVTAGKDTRVGVCLAFHVARGRATPHSSFFGIAGPINNGCGIRDSWTRGFP